MFESKDLLRIRRNPWLLVLATSPVLPGLPVFSVAGFLTPALGLALAALAGFFTLVAYQANWRPRVSSVAVRASADGVTIGGRFIHRGEIRAGLATSGVAPRVVLRRRLWFPVELQMTSQAEAHALLRALELDASQVFADFRGASWIHVHSVYWVGSLLFGPLVGFACSKLGAPTALGALLMVLSWTVLWCWPTRVRIGANGIAIQWFWVRRFVGYEDIEDVVRYEELSGLGITTIGLRLQAHEREVRVAMGFRRWTVFGAFSTGESNMAFAWERAREAAMAFHALKEAPGMSPERDEVTAQTAGTLEPTDRVLGATEFDPKDP